MERPENPAKVRQPNVTLASALETAALKLRAESIEYRCHLGTKARVMDKHVRKALAATRAEEARLIEQHAAMLAERAQREGGSDADA